MSWQAAGILFVFGIEAAAYYYYSMQDRGGNEPTKETMAPNTIDDFDISTVSEGIVIPEIFGTVRLSPNIVYYGRLTSQPHTVVVDTGGGGGGKK